MNLKFHGLLAATVTVATPSHAEMSWAEKCEYMGKIAEKVMANHQNRKPLQESLNGFDSVKSPELKAILRRVVMDAYDTPRFSTAKHQSDAIKDFADQTQLSCLKAE